MGSVEAEQVVEFQDVILSLSEALKTGEGYTLTPEENRAVCQGFMDAIDRLEERDEIIRELS